MIDAQFSLSVDELRSLALRFADPGWSRNEWIAYVELERRGDYLVVRVAYRDDRPAGVPKDVIASRERTGIWEVERREVAAAHAESRERAS